MMKFLYVLLLTVLGLLSKTEGSSDVCLQIGYCTDCLAGCAMGATSDCAIQDCSNPWDAPCNDPYAMSCGYYISICCAYNAYVGTTVCCGNLADIPEETDCYPVGFNICHAVVCLFDKCDELPDWLDDLFDDLFSFSSSREEEEATRRLAKAEMKRRLASGETIDDLFIMIAEKIQNEKSDETITISDEAKTPQNEPKPSADLIAWKYGLQIMRDAIDNGDTKAEAQAKAKEMLKTFDASN